MFKQRVGAVIIASALGLTGYGLAPGMMSAATAATDGTQAAVNYGWGPVLAGDEFSNTGAPDPAKWGVYSGPGHNGKGIRSPQAWNVANGVATVSGNSAGTTGGMSANFAQQQYGRWETRMRTSVRDPKYHPVVALWPNDNISPNCAEVDYAEGTTDVTRIKFNLHSARDRTKRFQTSAAKVLDTTQWHNYAVEWSPTMVTGYIDGVAWFTDTNPAELPPVGMHQTLQLDWFPDGTATTPTQMQVDWVRVYSAPDRNTPTGPAQIQAAASSGPGVALGASTTSISCGLANGGCYQSFLKGKIHWSPATGAHVTNGAIGAAWGAQGYERGNLGYPVTNEMAGVGGGVGQAYQGGSIYWSSGTGAHISVGAIRGAWGAQGYERGHLGYPVTNEMAGVRGGVGQPYQGGSIYWSPGTEAHISNGAIRTAWATTGYERGFLGYPTTNEYSIGNGVVAQNYEGGRILWSPAGGARIG